MFKPTTEEVIAAYKKKNYRFYKYGDYNLNFYGIRMDDVLDNYFSDLIGIIFNADGKTEHIQIPATTCPGLFGGHAAKNPREAGVAILVPDQYPHAWKFIDDYTTWLNYPFLLQVGKFRIWRDANKDEVVDHVNEQDAIGTGINCHRMSWNNVSGQPVNNWSEGCQGAEEPEFKKLLVPLRESSKKYGPIFSYTLFEKKDFELTFIDKVPTVTA